METINIFFVTISVSVQISTFLTAVKTVFLTVLIVNAFFFLNLIVVIASTLSSSKMVWFFYGYDPDRFEHNRIFDSYKCCFLGFDVCYYKHPLIVATLYDFWTDIHSPDKFKHFWQLSNNTVFKVFNVFGGLCVFSWKLLPIFIFLLFPLT